MASPPAVPDAGSTSDAASAADTSSARFDLRGPALYVALGKAGGVAAIDLTAWRSVGTAKLSDKFFPHHLSLSPDGTKVGVAAPSADFSGGHTHEDGDHGAGGESMLFVLDARTGEVTGQRKVDGTAHNLAFLSDGQTVAYAMTEHNMLHVAALPDLRDRGFFVVGGSPLEATPVPGGTLVVTANSGDGQIALTDTAAKTVVRTLEVGGNPIGAWLGRDGRAYVTSESDMKLSAVDLKTFAVIATVTLPGTPGQALPTSDGAEVWVAIENLGKVLILRGGDLRIEHEIVVGKRPHGLALSEDGKTFFLTDEQDGRIYELSIAGRTIVRSLEVGGEPNGVLVIPTR